MKHNMNVIQIRGIRGLILTAGAICCLAAGFIWFPGWVLMHLWNFSASYINNMPSISAIQGILLWGIIVASYFAFKKDKLVVCLKAPQGLSEDEIKEVFSDLKEQNTQEKIIQAMLKAREAELRYKNEENKIEDKEEITANKD